MMKKNVVFLAHPLGSDPQANLARAVRWYKWCCDHYPDHAFNATWMLNCMVYSDANEADRIIGIERGLTILSRCDEIWLVGGEVSPGMSIERATAEDLGLRVCDLTMLGPEPPQGPLSP